MVKSENVAKKTTVKKTEDSEKIKQPNKYEKLLSKKRKFEETSNGKENKENQASLEEKKAKKPRLDEKSKKGKVQTDNGGGVGDGEMIKKKKFEGKAVSGAKFQNGNGLKKKLADGKKFDGKKNGVKGGSEQAVQLNRQEQKKLKVQRKQKKQGEQFSINVNIKKIWETLRRLNNRLFKKQRTLILIFFC